MKQCPKCLVWVEGRHDHCNPTPEWASREQLLTNYIAETESLRQQRNDLLGALDNLSKVKGRYNTEVAWRRMADLVAELKTLKLQEAPK
jgi:hypothetical protein